MIRVAQRHGWASDSGNLGELNAQAQALGLQRVANRHGDPTQSLLRPVSRSGARTRSMSAQVGLGEQPLHTDGAHHELPPDFVVLLSERPSATPTWLRLVLGRTANEAPFDDLCHGMFLVNIGATSFFASALAHGTRLRYDPVCMAPCDSRAVAAAAYLSDRSDAIPYEWHEESQVLLIDNRRALHGRGALADDDWDRELTRVNLVKAAA